MAYPSPDRATADQIAGLVEQMIRDQQTLRMDPAFHAPSRAFYEERLASYRYEVDRLRTQAAGLMGLFEEAE